MGSFNYLPSILALLLIQGSVSFSLNVTRVAKQGPQKIYVHLMPWFETRQTSEDGNWGIHWTMANQNPDIIVGENDKRQIAAHFYPEIGPYGSGDPSVIDYQIQMMKYAGVDGVLVDWPGTTQAWDYPKNMRNADAFISKLEAAGLEFAIVYEDHNLGMAHDGGMIGDILAQGRADMEWLQNNYFRRANYVKINGAPLLMTFGPQTLTNPSDWSNIFSSLSPKPTFLTLWYQQEQAAGSAAGEYPWIYSDFMDGLRNFYQNRPLGVKFGVAYPGFNTFYANGGWPGPNWGIGHDGTNTFSQTLDLALSSGVQWIQVATWNDYGEGTIVEPSLEFGNGFLNILQNKLKVPYGDRELNLIKEYYALRKKFETEGNKASQAKLDDVYDALNHLQPEKAAQIMSTL
jgi:hypothetical protein